MVIGGCDVCVCVNVEVDEIGRLGGDASGCG